MQGGRLPAAKVGGRRELRLLAEQRMLGHANLATTSRYLKTTRRVMQDAMRKYAEHVERCTNVAHETDKLGLGAEVSQRTASREVSSVVQVTCEGILVAVRGSVKGCTLQFTGTAA